jgi:uncharacterized protein YbaR (Trm112 family)
LNEGVKNLVDLTCCPETRQSLRVADDALLSGLNARIAAGELRNRQADLVSEPLTAALVREDGQWLYPVRDGLPILLSAEAVPCRV